MDFLKTVLEESKKVGRITGYIVILGITGTLSIMQKMDSNSVSQSTIDDWIKLTMIATTFYFLTSQNKGE